jgi:NAD(P)H-dependent FMN reductase
MAKKIGIILGSTRQGRISPAIAEWVAANVAKHPELSVELLDLAKINLPFFDEPTIPSIAPGVSEAARSWAAKVSGMDGFIVLTSEYNAGYSAPLKNAIDYLKDEWLNRPIFIVSYGFGGGSSAAHQLGEVFTRLKASQIEPNIAIMIGDKLNANGAIENPEESLAIHDAELEIALKAIEAFVPETVQEDDHSS